MATILDCNKIQPQISEYIDGALENADAAWAIKMHLASCAVCTQVASELTQTTRLLQTLPSMDTSAGFEAALARRLADQVLQPRVPTLFDRVREWWSDRPQLRPAFAGAAALAAVVPAAFVIVSHSGGIGASHNNPTAIRAVSAKNAADAAGDDLWNEHMSYASSEPLADSSAGMLETSSPTAATAVAPGS